MKGMRAILLLGAAAGAACAQCDFSSVAALAQGAVDGQNVQTPVTGFELLLLRNGEPVFHRAFGSWTIGRAAQADSATKTLSGALIVSLTESSAQPFSLDTRLADLIPAFDGVTEAITVRQSFAHMSGLRDSIAVSSQTMTLQQAAQSIANRPSPLENTPGTVFVYGGTSMHAAGAAAEIAGAAPWNTLFAQRISGPMGMSSTTFTLTTPTNPRIAGGARSTAEDFGAFMEMLRRGGLHGNVRVLQETSVQAMFTRQTPVGVTIGDTPLDSPFTDGADYGVGVWLDERGPDGELLGALAAGARGFSSWIDFDEGLVGVFATDLTLSGNIQPLLYMIRAAAQDAVRACRCDPIDFNGDGLSPDNRDLEDFLGVFGGGACNTGSCGDIDFNNDGLAPDNDDIEAFFRVFGGGAC